MIYLYLFIFWGAAAYTASAIQPFVKSRAFGWFAWVSGLTSFLNLAWYLISRNQDIDQAFLIMFGIFQQLLETHFALH